MQIYFGMNINKFINYFNQEELKYMVILMIKYLYHFVDLYVHSIMLEELIHHNMLFALFLCCPLNRNILIGKLHIRGFIVLLLGCKGLLMIIVICCVRCCWGLGWRPMYALVTAIKGSTLGYLHKTQRTAQ